MKEYFITLITVSLVGGMIVTLLPDGNTSKHVKLLCSLCVVACIIFPISSFFGDFFDKESVVGIFRYEEDESYNYDEIYNNSLTEYELINAQVSLKQEIIQGIGVSDDAFDLKIITDENNGVICISSVTVRIYGSGLTVNPREVEKYVSERLGCPCEFVYDL